MTTSRFDWPAIFRASGIVAGVTAAFGLLVPLVGALAVPAWDTLIVSGSEIYRWLYWALAWVLMFLQGSWMLRMVHDRIIDDMLVTGAIVMVILLVVKFIVWIAYWPVGSEGQRLLPITFIDVAGALLTFVVALIAARTNRFTGQKSPRR